MKKFLLLLLFIPLVFSCSSDEDGDMKLVIENNLNNSRVTSVVLQDYDFENLSIESGNTRTFILNNGIPSGSLDIEVRVHLECPTRPSYSTVRVDFFEGKTTTIQVRERPNKPLEGTACWFELIN
tara:strand:- start:33 stop:407 length:375 start_codon:yes stop_codon:yes gene_type:complete